MTYHNFLEIIIEYPGIVHYYLAVELLMENWDFLGNFNLKPSVEKK